MNMGQPPLTTFVRPQNGKGWLLDPPELPTTCSRPQCGKSMRGEDVHPDYPEQMANELQNECTLMFVGGYGSFIDCVFLDGGQTGLPTVRICHECAHELSEWLGIDVSSWHTHSYYGGQHEDHHNQPGED